MEIVIFVCRKFLRSEFPIKADSVVYDCTGYSVTTLYAHASNPVLERYSFMKSDKSIVSQMTNKECVLTIKGL